eukprot:1133539-Rhodomonas_salina.2
MPLDCEGCVCLRARAAAEADVGGWVRQRENPRELGGTVIVSVLALVGSFLMREGICRLFRSVSAVSVQRFGFRVQILGIRV